MPTKTHKILSQYDEKISSLGFLLRDYLLSELENISELSDVSSNTISYAYGPGYKGIICTIIPSLKGIKLGFNRGTELADPSKLLTGSGKLHLYTEIKDAKDLQNPALKKLLKEAVIAFEKRNSKAGK